jgi:hypothetical protein
MKVQVVRLNAFFFARMYAPCNVLPCINLQAVALKHPGTRLLQHSPRKASGHLIANATYPRSSIHCRICALEICTVVFQLVNGDD